ncbi:MAG TPA: HAD family hydrolase [Polyangiales bacterium]|nr:HAD family hydrolase [Polyangiales bacterium]
MTRSVPYMVVLIVAACGASETQPPPQSAMSVAQQAAQSPSHLRSWNPGRALQAIRTFVSRVTTAEDPAFVPVQDRIAVFDNDGTLWSEQPVYVQLAFTVDRIQELAPRHPEWQTTQPFQAVLEKDWLAVEASGERGRLALLAAAYAETTTLEFDTSVQRWIASARHPRFDRPYTELVYRPMLELIQYLHANEFRVFIVSGGGVDFMRPWVERVYGIPPERVVGSRIAVHYENSETPQLWRTAQIDLIDDRAGKPVGIHQAVGRRPIAAFGNSDGDFEMLEWTTSGPGARLGIIVHHTDNLREWAYDRGSKVGKLERALDEAPARGWVIVDMKRDWNQVYAFKP